MAIDPKNDPHARIVVKPLPSQRKGEGRPSAVLGEGQRGRDSRAATFADPFVRAENEDDDGYDPIPIALPNESPCSRKTPGISEGALVFEPRRPLHLCAVAWSRCETVRASNDR